MREELQLKDENYVKKVLWDIWDYLPLWIVVDFVFVIFCFPAIALILVDLHAPSLLSTILTFPTFAGITYCASKVAKGEAASLRDFLTGVRRFLRRSLALGAIMIFLVFISVSTYQVIQTNPDQKWLIIPWALQLSALLFWSALSVYSFGIMTLYDADLRTTLSSSLLLTVKNKMPTVGMLSLAVLMAFLARLTRIGLILVFPAVFAVFTSNLTLLLVSKYQDKFNSRKGDEAGT